MTSNFHHATLVANASAFAEKMTAMGFRKRLASKVLGTDIDSLCLEWHETGMDVGFYDGVEKATQDIITDLLSDAVLSLELDVEMMQRIVEIIEN